MHWKTQLLITKKICISVPCCQFFHFSAHVSYCEILHSNKFYCSYNVLISRTAVNHAINLQQASQVLHDERTFLCAADLPVHLVQF